MGLTAGQRTVVCVAAEFPPCNLTAGHRTRLLARHLPEFGYTPVVLTLRPECYETRLDPDLLGLLPPDLEVVRSRAVPTRPVRVVGDLGARSLPFHLAAVGRLAAHRRADLLFLPVPPNLSALLGPACRLLFGLPYVIDYIDPIVYAPTDSDQRSIKAMAGHAVNRLLEPVVMAGAGGLTGVSEGYYADVVRRIRRLDRIPKAGFPYGGEPLDHDAAAARPGPPRLLDRPDLRGKRVLVYAGALLPRAHDTLRAVLGAARRWRAASDPRAADLRLLFVGTGRWAADPASGLVGPIARECGAADFVVEVADRQPYLDVLAALGGCEGVMVLGSTDPFYTASKMFQALYSARPVLAVLHADSTAAVVVRGQPGVELVTFTAANPVATRADVLLAALTATATAPAGPVARDLAALEPYTARASARRLAGVFDAVLARRGRR